MFHWSKTISTVDQLYQEIKKGLQHLVEKYGEKSIFIGPDGAQTTSQYFKFPGLLTVTDLASAEEAIELIVSQGEGAQGDVEESHFRIFSGIKEEFHQLKALRPKFEAARPVLANPYAREAHDISNFNLLDNPVAIQFSNLFNAAYEVMTRILIRFFAYAEENKTELTLLIKTSIDMMKMVIRPLGELITKIPAGPSFPDNTAGPNFQFYRSIHLLPHKRAAWLIFHERLLEIADYCNKLATPGQFKERIEEIEKNLREMAGHFENQIQDFK